MKYIILSLFITFIYADISLDNSNFNSNIHKTTNKAYKYNLEQKKRAREARENQSSGSEGNLKNICTVVIDNDAAYRACTKDIAGLAGLGDRGINALYAARKQCSYLAGNDSTGLSYLCSNPTSSGCIGLKAPQSTIDACYQCGGSNLWLRVYATGTVLECY